MNASSAFLSLGLPKFLEIQLPGSRAIEVYGHWIFSPRKDNVIDALRLVKPVEVSEEN
ncbi:MAG: hypothetical protein ACO4AI_07150 [Prochlorothrix sp.]|nr:hypothetical protein [Prochlorothrix sp.]